MSLSDFLGKTNEISIIDFLSGNKGFDYTIGQLTGYLNDGSDVYLSEFDVEHLLIKLIYNGIVVENDGRFKLADNNIVSQLIGSVFANSYHIAETEEPDENKILREIRKDVFG